MKPLGGSGAPRERKATLRPRLALWGLVVVLLVTTGVGRIPSAGRNDVALELPGSTLNSQLDLATKVPEPYRDAAVRAVQARREGRVSSAVEGLADLALDLPENGSVQTALGEAFLARSATSKGSPRDLALGLDAAEHAVALAPRSAEALFVRAEIATRLHLTAAGISGWTRFLAVDSDSPRAGHARAAIETLRVPSSYDLWESGDRARFEAAARTGDSKALFDLVKRYPLFARLETEEILFPRWGRSQAPTELAALRGIGKAFAVVLRDSMVADTVASIETAAPEGRRKLARGLAAFGEGMRCYRQIGSGEPGPWLSAAALDLAGSPFAGWPRYYGTVLLQRGSVAEADAELRTLGSLFDAVRYPTLGGRIRWLQATGGLFLERPEAALKPYGDALEILSRSEGEQIRGFMHLLVGEAYARLGDRDQEWRDYGEALSRLQLTELRAQEATLYEIVESLLGENRTWAALAFSRDLRTVCRRWGRPGALAEQALQFGRLKTQLGDDRGSLQTLKAAQGFAEKVNLPDLRERFEATIEMAEGRSLVARDPLAAIEHLTSALTRHRRTEFRYHEAGLLVARADAFRSFGRYAEAAKDLLESIEIYEGKRGATRDPQLRQSSFEEAQVAFDSMISLQAESLGDAGKAFSFAERSRARLLFDQIAGHGSAPELGLPLEAESIQRAWPTDSVLVEYAVLPDRLYIWSVASGRLRLHVDRVSSRELERAVGTLARGVARGELGLDERAASQKLYRSLIQPILGEVPQGADLSVVPDRFLARLPFAALLDPSDGRYLIEDRMILIQPSASFYLAARNRRSKQPRGSGPVFVIGDPAFSRAAYPRLRQLPEARAEAREIADLDSRSILLIGHAATRSAFLRVAPEARVIHIAAHAILDARNPGLSRIVLAPEVDGTGGAITAQDIAKLDLSHANLVVLSICNGVAGGDSGRENISGLAASFLAAGVGTVVASQWEVDDAWSRTALRRLLQGASRHRDLRSSLVGENSESQKENTISARSLFAVYGQ